MKVKKARKKKEKIRMRDEGRTTKRGKILKKRKKRKKNMKWNKKKELESNKGNKARRKKEGKTQEFDVKQSERKEGGRW